MYLMGIYILTAVISIAIAMLLAYAARISAQVKTESSGRTIPVLPTKYTDSSLREAITDKITELVGPKQRGEEISNAISNIFNEELSKRTTIVTREITQKYDSIIQEKAKNEEVAWKKYNRVLSDHKKTEAVIHSIAEGLVVVDAQGKIVMMNPAAEKLLGASQQEKIGRPIAENPKEEELISLVKGAEGTQDREIELISQHDETKRVLRASTAVIENENGETVGMVSVLSDITKQKELDRMKDNFVANVSHELRTPLVAIDKAFALILGKEAGALNPQQEQFISIADRNLKRLSLLINDLLDLAKLEAGKMEINKRPCSIGEVIRESKEALDAWAKAKSIAIETKIPAGLPQAHIDPNRIIQVLNNLIGNAIKFTPQNGVITIEAALLEREVRVSVQDTGLGIAKENLEKVFSKFYQIGERVPTDISGTGIGLSIAKEIIELHRGKIWAENADSKGARFIFTVPLSLV